VKNLFTVSGKRPKVARSAQVHANAYLLGDVTLEDEVQVWPGAIIRGYPNPVVISRGSLVMDDAIIASDQAGGVIVGERSLIGQRAVLVGCSVGPRCLVGPGSRVMEGVIIGQGSIIEQGVVVGQGAKVPSGMLVGAGGVKGHVSKEQAEMFLKHRDGLARKFLEYGPLQVLKGDG